MKIVTSTAQRIEDYEITTLVTDETWLENCYIVQHVGCGEVVIIDPGADQEQIRRAVRDMAGKLQAIILTHAHHDHVGAVAGLQDEFAVPCYLHEGDQRLLRQAHTYALVFAARVMQPIVKASFFTEELPVIGNMAIKTIFTPGHSPGGVSYHFGNFIFTGDTLLYRYVGRSDTPGADPEQLVLSVDRLLAVVSDDTVIFGGHGRSWNGQEAKLWWQKVRSNPPQYKQFGGI